ncbi:MAG: response regulator [Candidatus Aureabacteria bacterium]|nr:response regulator [Candidatus Auribacterota bacterium]
MVLKTRVLIVDDEVSFAESLSDLLEQEGYKTVVVHSGEEALGKIKKTTFDIILLDVKLPAMNGVETYKKINKIVPQARVIMMTAYSVEYLIRDALKEGAYGVVYKPFDVEKFLSMVEAARKNDWPVMVVDDDLHVRECFKDVLESRGYNVSLAKDGREALQIAKERRHDVAFIDMKLPLLNGLETYLAIKEHNPKITVVLMTGYREEMGDLVQQALDQSAYTCLYKPFDPREALVLIEEISKARKRSPKMKKR